MRATTTETAYNAIAMGNGASAASEDAVVVGSNSAARTGTVNATVLGANSVAEANSVNATVVGQFSAAGKDSVNATVVGSRSYVRPNTNDGTALGHYAGVWITAQQMVHQLVLALGLVKMKNGTGIRWVYNLVGNNTQKYYCCRCCK